MRGLGDEVIIFWVEAGEIFVISYRNNLTTI